MNHGIQAGHYLKVKNMELVKLIVSLILLLIGIAVIIKLYLIKKKPPTENKSKFESFELTIKVKHLEQLEALWLLSNSDSETEKFLNQHLQRKQYTNSLYLSNPLGIYWRKLEKERIKYITQKENTLKT